MFRSSSKKDLERRLQEAHAENARLRMHPFLAIAEDLHRSVAEDMDKIGADAAYEQALEQQRTELRAMYIRGHLARLVRVGIEQEEERIKDEAKRIAEAEARQEIERFRREEAPMALEDLVLKLRPKRYKALVEAEKRLLEEEAIRKLRQEARTEVSTKFSDGDFRTSNNYNKERAAAFRETTERTRLLMLDTLLPDDVLDVDFVKKGEGNEPFTTTDTYDYSCPNDIAVRSLQIKVVDPAEGRVLIVKDKIVSGKGHTPIYPMTPATLFCLNPISRNDEISAINKAAPLAVVGHSHEPLIDTDLEVWRVDLNKYRVLS